RVRRTADAQPTDRSVSPPGRRPPRPAGGFGRGPARPVRPGPRRGHVRRAARPPRAGRLGALPPDGPVRVGRRGRVPGHVPGPRPGCRSGPEGGVGRELAARGCLPHRTQGPVRATPGPVPPRPTGVTPRPGGRTHLGRDPGRTRRRTGP